MLLSDGLGLTTPTVRNPPPHMNVKLHGENTSDERSERCFLGCILFDPSSYGTLSSPLVPEDFTVEANREVFIACAELLKHGTFEFPLVASELERKGKLKDVGGLSYIASLMEEVPTAYHIEQYAEILRGLRLRRSLVAVGYGILQVAVNQELTPEESMNESTRLLRSLEVPNAGSGIHTMEESVAEEWERIANVSQYGGEKLLRLGLDSLDEVLGGVGRSDVVILAARPSMGKTALALQIGLSIAERNEGCVGIASLEMSRSELVQRALANQSGVYATVIRSAQMTEDNMQKVLTASERLSALNMVLVDEPPFTADSICNRFRKVHRRTPLRIAIVDYLQLIQSPRRNTRNDEMSEVSRAFKLLAMELKVPILLLSQLSRDVEKRPGARKVPVLSDLRDSGAIEQDADSVLMLYRDDYYDENSERKGLVEVHVKKNRHGKTGVATLRFDGGKQQFTSVDTR